MPAAIVWPATPLVWYSGSDLDLQRNATILPAAQFATAKNKGSLGSGWDATAPGTQPRLRYNNGFGSILFAGGDILRTATNAALQAQRTVVLIGTQTPVGTTCVYMDGSGVGGRMALYYVQTSTNFSVNGGAILNINPSEVVGQYNCMCVQFNGANTRIDFNFPNTLQVNNFTTGNAGTDSPTAITLGANFDGTVPLTGEIVELAVLPGLIDPQSVLNAVSAWGGSGYWPKPSFTNYTFSPIVDAGTFAIVGGDKLVALGDSITQGSPQPSWLPPFLTAVNAKVVTPITVVNEGAAGDTTALMLARYATDVASKSPFQRFVLEAGINDYLNQVPISTYLQNIQQIFCDTRAQISGLTGMMMIGPATADERVPYPGEIQLSEYVAAAKWLAGKNGVPYVDMRADRFGYDSVNNVPAPGNLFSPGPLGQTLLTPDGVHNNPTGLARYVAAVMAKCTFSG